MTLPPQITVRNIEPVPDVEPFVIKEIAALERVKGGVKIDHDGGEKIDHSIGS